MLRPIVAAGAAVLAGLVIPATADADTTPTYTTAADAVEGLRAWGYDMQFNGFQADARYAQREWLQRCRVTGIHPTVAEPLPEGQFQVVYLDLSCPSHNGSDLSTDTSSDTSSSS